MKKGIHSKATYRLFYEKYSTIFIDHYVLARNQDYEKNEAFLVAKIWLQDVVIQDMFTNRLKTLLIVKAYSDVKNDHQLYRAAIQKFNASN